MKKLSNYYVLGIIGSVLLFFVGWEYNIPLMVWIAFPLLIIAFRAIDKWCLTLSLIGLIIVAKYFSMRGGWDIDLWMQIVFPCLVATPLIASLYLDRALSKNMSPFLATLIFPSTYIVLDYLLTYANIGMTFSLAYTQSTFLEFAQSASIFGSWFVGYIAAWFAPVMVLLAANITRLKTVRKPLIIFFSILAVIMLFGSLRLVFNRPQSPTVRIASITVEHDQNYWDITDNNTPRDNTEDYKSDMKKIHDELFTLSEKAANYGAKVIFWSEGNCPLYEDDYLEFIEKSRNFAKEKQVYFMPTCVVLLYDKTENENLAVMINPEGEVVYSYEKTISWYPSESNGIIPVVQTPYGKLSTAICFDMDSPALISQANDADIMLVPGYDTKKIADYHTRVSFLRGIENGFSTIRQANEGASISSDYMGNTLSYQNYFYTDNRIMITDTPTRGVWTFYGLTGEIFLWIVLLGFIIIIVCNIRIMRKNRREKN